MLRVTKSDFVVFKTCRREFWLRKREPKKSILSFWAQAGNFIGDLSRVFLDEEIEGTPLHERVLRAARKKLVQDYSRSYLVETKDRDAAIEETQLHWDKHEIIFEPAICYEFEGAQCFCRLDAFRFADKKHLEVKSFLNPTKHMKTFLFDLAWQQWVLRNSGVPCESLLMHLNKLFYPNKNQPLFLILNEFTKETEKTKRLISIAVEIERIIASIPDDIRAMKRVLNVASVSCLGCVRTTRCKHCSRREDCGIPADWAGDLWCCPAYLRKKYENASCSELLPTDITIGEKRGRADIQIRLINAIRENRIINEIRNLHIDSASSLDFETLVSAYPVLDDMHPWQSRIPFACSIGKYSKTGLSDRDGLVTQFKPHLTVKELCNELGDFLLSKLSGTGPILCWSDAERSIIWAMAEHCTQVQDIARRLVDMCAISRDGYAHPACYSSFGLKLMAKSICGIDYNDCEADALKATDYWLDGNNTAVKKYVDRDTEAVDAVTRVVLSTASHIRNILGVDLAGKTNADTSIVGINKNRELTIIDRYDMVVKKANKKTGAEARLVRQRRKYSDSELSVLIQNNCTVMDVPHGICRSQNEDRNSHPPASSEFRDCELVGRKLMVGLRTTHTNEVALLGNRCIFDQNLVQYAARLVTWTRVKSLFSDEQLRKRRNGIGGGETVPSLVQAYFAHRLFEIDEYDAAMVVAHKIKSTPGSDAASKKQRKADSNTDDMLTRRQEIIEILLNYGIIKCSTGVVEEIVRSDDTFEAMWCAIAGWYLKYGTVLRLGHKQHYNSESTLIIPKFDDLISTISGRES